MTKINPFLSPIEQEIALILIKKTYDQEIDENRCAKIARQILELFPENIDIELLEKNLPKLKEIYSELTPLIIKYLELINNKKSKEQIEQVKRKINHILYGTNSTSRN
jgi:hypothetical protein